MKKEKNYSRTVLDAPAYEAIMRGFKDIVTDDTKTRIWQLKVEKQEVTWSYDTFEEFLSELRTDHTKSRMHLCNQDIFLEITSYNWGEPHLMTSIEITAPQRESIIRMGSVIDRACESCFVHKPEMPSTPLAKPKVFIGHGGSSLWRDLKDHLQDHHGYEVITYETGSRAGHTIRDVVSEMLQQSSFAILVMTGEDEMPDGSWRARQNVVHELGLFQGRLGFTKAIVLKEENTEEFSNISGVQQIRFARGNIKETFGDVLAVLRREFGDPHQQPTERDK